MNFKKTIKFAFPWVLTIVLFVIIFSKIEFSEALIVFGQADVKLVSLSILVCLFMYVFFSPGRQREILRILDCPLSFKEAFILRIGSIPLKGILPLKGGELTRIAYLKKRHHLSYPKGLTSVLFGYALSAAALSFFVFVGWLFDQFALKQRYYLGLLFFLFLMLVPLLKRLIKIFLKNKEIIDRLNSKTLSLLFFYSLGFEGLKLLNTYLLFTALDIEVPFGVLLRLVPLSILASMLPLTPSGLGTRESTILLIFSNYATPERLLGASLLVSFVNRLIPILFGLFFMKLFLFGLLKKNQIREGEDKI